MLPTDGGDCEEVLAQFAKAGIDVDALAAQLQSEGAESFVESWNDLMHVISSKSAALEKPRALKSRELAGSEQKAESPSACTRKEHDNGNTLATVPRNSRNRESSQGVERARNRITRRSRNCICANCSQTIPSAVSEWRSRAVGLYLDYSKNRITDETLKLLLQLAEESGLRAHIDAMFRGDKINITEKRAVLHMALRAPKDASILVDGENVVPEVHAVLDKMAEFSGRVRSGEWKGHTGKRIRNVINIGIGGSDLGPVMAYEALKHYSERAMTFRFVSNVDGTDFAEAVRDLDPAETLFIISSKTFTTLETMTNAHTAREWSLAGSGRRREIRGQALCRRLDQRSGGVEVRHRYREHV